MAKKKILARRPEVIARWIGFKLKPPIEIFARKRDWIKYSHSQRRRIRELDKAIVSTYRLSQRSENSGFDQTSLVADAALFSLLAIRDIESVKMTVVWSNDKWLRKLTLRLMILTCYEWDTREIYGTKFFSAIERRSGSVELKTKAISEIREFRKRHDQFKKKYRHVRNDLIAHRVSDVIAYRKSVLQLREIEVLNDIGDLLEPLKGLMASLTSTLSDNGSTDAIRRLLSELRAD